jgi:CubicO group peptidase (beta-lactamase class C family)
MKATTLILLLAVILSACAPAILPTATPVPPATPIPPTAIPAQDPIALGAELDALVQKNYQAGVFDGSILVARDGQVLLSQGYGFADRTKKTPNTPQTKFRLGCVTKQFTAMAILLLQAQGKLTVQDKLCTYVANCPEIFKPITLHHLLTHASGVPSSTQWDQPGDKMLSKVTRLLNVPGEAFLYADVDYKLLGKVIETVSGQSYEAFMQQHLFAPLQMSNTGYEHKQTDLAKGYASAQGDLARTPYDPDDLYAAGALYSTVEDLYRWDQALYSDEILPQSVLGAMFASQMPVPDGYYYGKIYGQPGWGYGYGWFIAPGQPRLVLHGGMPYGIRNEVRRYLDDKVTIIQLANQEGVMIGPIGDAIAEKLGAK